MSAGFVTSGFGASSLRGLTKSNAMIDIYVDPVSGNDFNLGTIGSPFKTLGIVDSLLPDRIDHPVNVHLHGGSYQLPSVGFWLKSRLLNNLVRFFADTTWDPSAITVLHNQPAQAGTVANLVKQTGLVADAHIGQTIEVTTGGVVQRKTIKSNTTTDVVPCEVFNPVPNPGDAVRITKTNVVFTTPAVGGSAFDVYQLAADQVCGCSPYYNTPMPMGIVFENIALISDITFVSGELSLGTGNYYLYGVELRSSNDSTTLVGNGARMFGGLNLASRANDVGWGVGTGLGYSTQAHPIVSTQGSGVFEGYFASPEAGAPLARDGGTVLLWGGFSHFAQQLITGSFQAFGNSDSTISYDIVDATGQGGLIVIDESTFLGRPPGPVAANASFACSINGTGVGILVSIGASMTLGASVTGTGGGGVAVLVERGARLYVEANPQYGGAGGLWKTPNTAGVTRASFVPGFALVDPVDASAIIVTS